MDFWKKPSNAMRRVYVAREKIARRNPFFASILFNAKMVESDKHNTIWTDGINVYFNPEYVEHPETQEFIEGDILECVMHAALQHVGRRKARDNERWNASCDFSVRPLVHQYFKQHPELMKGDGLFPNKAAEEIYELLPEQSPDNQGKGKGQGNKGPKSKDGPGKGEMPGGMEDPDGEGAEEALEQAEKNWQRSVANAMEKAKKAGNMPGNLLRLIEELLPAEKLDWRDIIRDMSRDAKSKLSRTWTRPNRRRLGGGEYMPGYGNDNIYNLVICFDVSGSVSEEMLRDMKSEVASVMDQDLINSATLIAVDTRPQSVTTVTNSLGVAEWHPTGGGGTDFRSALDLINQEYGQSIGMVFLTDLETNSFGKEPPFPVVWVNFGSNKSLKAPYGRTVEY